MAHLRDHPPLILRASAALSEHPISFIHTTIPAMNSLLRFAHRIGAATSAISSPSGHSFFSYVSDRFYDEDEI